MCICSFCICSCPRRCRCHLKHREKEKKRLRRGGGREYPQLRDPRGRALLPLRASTDAPQRGGHGIPSRFLVRCSQCDTAVLGEDFSCWPSPYEKEHREWRRRPAGGSVSVPAGMLGLPLPPGWKKALPYLWHKGNPESPCLAGLGACCRTRWATGRSFGRTRSRLLFILGQARASAKPPPLQPAHGSARLLPRALLIHSPGGPA